jgi:hypothetical protein
MRYAPNDLRARNARDRRPAVKKTSTVATSGSEILKEQKLDTEGIHQFFDGIPCSRIALETGTHSPG